MFDAILIPLSRRSAIALFTFSARLRATFISIFTL